jgi:hypothetical protein
VNMVALATLIVVLAVVVGAASHAFSDVCVVSVSVVLVVRLSLCGMRVVVCVCLGCVIVLLHIRAQDGCLRWLLVCLCGCLFVWVHFVSGRVRRRLICDNMFHHSVVCLAACALARSGFIARVCVCVCLSLGSRVCAYASLRCVS